MLSIWKDSRVWILTLCAFFINSLVYGFTNWLPTFFTSAKGMSLTDAAKINSISGVFALIGALGGSYIVGRYFAGKEKIVIAIFCIVGGCSMLGVYTFDSIILITLLLGIANFSMLVAFVTLMSIPLKLFINERFSPSYATIGTGGVMGGIFAPLIIGELIRVSNGNFLSTFIFFILMGIGAAGAIIFLKMNRQGGTINE
nr:MFS transporter [Carnobacterium maltaromaticum]